MLLAFQSFKDQNVVKRKLSELYNWEFDDEIPEIADYKGTLKLVTLQSSFDGEKVMLNTDENLSSCINRWRSAQKTSGENNLFKLCVQASSGCADQQDQVDK